MAAALSALLAGTAAAGAFSQGAEAELAGQSGGWAAEARDVYSAELGQLPEPTLHWDGAVRVYVGADVFGLDTVQMDRVTEALEQGGWIYLVPAAFADGSTVVLNVQKGQPLREDAAELFTEAEKREIAEDEGKWIVSAWTRCGPGETLLDYEERLVAAIGEIPAGTVLAGGQDYFVEPVALIPDGEGRLSRLYAFDAPRGDPGDVEPAEIAPDLYDYAAVRDLIRQMVPPDPELCGDGWELPDAAAGWSSQTVAGLAALAVLAAVVALALCRGRRGEKP